MDPQQELFIAIRGALVELFGNSVYDGCLPPEGVPYPFVYLADNIQSDRETKTLVIGEVTQYIHVWHNDPTHRGTVSNMLLKIKQKARSIEHTRNFGWMLKNIDERIMPDDSTANPLLHGIVTITYKFS